MAFSLLSFNLYSGPFSSSEANQNRYACQEREIRRLKPDLICLQEFNTHEIEDHYTEFLTSLGFTGFWKKRSVLSLLRGMVLTSALIAVHRGARKFVTGTQEHGLAIWWKKDVFDLVSKTSVPFHNVGSDPLSFVRERGFVSTVLRHRLSGRSFRVINTHLNLISAKDRLAQTEEILSFLAATTSQQQPTVLVGDFNVENEQEPALTRLLQSGFVDVFHGTGNTYLIGNPDSDWFGKMGSGDKRCDFMLVRGLWASEFKLISGSDLRSDHEGLYAKIRLAKRNSRAEKIDPPSRIHSRGVWQ